MISFSTLLLSLFITLALIPLLMKQALRMNSMDWPDQRKVHTHPIPRTGGIAMAIGTLIPVLVWNTSQIMMRGILSGALVVVIFGVIDDIRSLGYKVKFAAQFSAALIAVFSAGIRIQNLGSLLPRDLILPNWISIPLTIFFIVGVTNAVNLADGLDGLAAGISLLSFCCIGYMAYLQGNESVTLISVAIIGSIIGFLRYNTWPASIFMGDTGSQFLGFMAATLSIALTQANTPLSPLLPLIILGFPVLDTLTVMSERIAQGKSPFLADKNHFHHKLMRLGLFHTEAVIVIYILQSFLITSAYLFRFHSEWFLLSLYMIFSALILSGFFITDHFGWKIKRYSLVDRVIKGRLKRLRDKNILIKASFNIIYVGIPFLLLFSCLILLKIPGYFSLLSIIIAGIILLVWLIQTEWMNKLIQPALYIIIPFIIYFGHKNMVEWMNSGLIRLYNLSFGILILFVIMTLKFTRRRKGFKSNPMDFLILFIALVVPNLPDAWIQSYNMGLVAAKIIVLFFSYEVLIGELRGKLKKVGLSTIAALAVIGIKGI